MNILISLIGLVLIFLAYISFKKSNRLAKNGIKTIAKIIEVTKKKGRDQDGYTTYSYVPLLEFKTKDNKVQNFKSDVSSGNKNKYKIGDEMKIIYDPQKPEEACVDSFVSMWIIPGILGFAGILMLIGGFVS